MDSVFVADVSPAKKGLEVILLEEGSNQVQLLGQGGVHWRKHYKNQEDCPQAVFVYKFWGVSTVGMTFERAGNVMLSR